MESIEGKREGEGRLLPPLPPLPSLSFQLTSLSLLRTSRQSGMTLAKSATFNDFSQPGTSLSVRRDESVPLSPPYDNYDEEEDEVNGNIRPSTSGLNGVMSESCPPPSTSNENGRKGMTNSNTFSAWLNAFVGKRRGRGGGQTTKIGGMRQSMSLCELSIQLLVQAGKGLSVANSSPFFSHSFPFSLFLSCAFSHFPLSYSMDLDCFCLREGKGEWKWREIEQLPKEEFFW